MQWRMDESQRTEASSSKLDSEGDRWTQNDKDNHQQGHETQGTVEGSGDPDEGEEEGEGEEDHTTCGLHSSSHEEIDETGPLTSDDEDTEPTHHSTQQSLRKRYTSLRPQKRKFDDVANLFGNQNNPLTDNIQGHMSDDEESIATSTQSNIYGDQIFPTAGVRCVGCNICDSILKVDAFIDNNYMRMGEEALYRLAATHYKEKIVAPVVAEGNSAPDWNWQEIQQHYTFHTVNHKLKRKGMINDLTAMRSILKDSMVRITDSDGKEEKDIDGAKADRYLKIVAAESKERQLLESKAQHERR